MTLARRLGPIASRLEAIATRVEAIAISFLKDLQPFVNLESPALFDGPAGRQVDSG